MPISQKESYFEKSVVDFLEEPALFFLTFNRNL